MNSLSLILHSLQCTTDSPCWSIDKLHSSLKLFEGQKNPTESEKPHSASFKHIVHLKINMAQFAC